MKRILVLGAGGAAANGFCRALRLDDCNYYLIGTNCNEYGMALAETDEIHLLPHAKEPDYRSKLLALCDKIKPDFVHAQDDGEVAQLSLLRERLPVFLPNHYTVRICQNKWYSHCIWRHRVPQPQTKLIYFPSDLEKMLGKHGEVWLRNIRGAGGAGSIATDSLTLGKAWLDRHKGWGQFTAAEVLTPDTATFTALFKDGKLIARQGRKRISWGYARNQPSGVSGITGIGETTDDGNLMCIARDAIDAIDNKPHGLYGVDCTKNADGEWCPTEINIGRFHTTVSEFFAQAGMNIPNAYCRAFFGEKVELVPYLPNGLKWARVMDREPVLL